MLFDAIRKPTYLEYLGDQTIEVAFPISKFFLKTGRLLKKTGLFSLSKLKWILYISLLNPTCFCFDKADFPMKS